VYPINGLGIYYAMKGGKLCAEALLNGDIRLFDEYWRTEYGDELRSAANAFSRIYGNVGFAMWFAAVVRNLFSKSEHSIEATT
jgi:flavin-dependent dehydrogenase